MEDSMTYQAIVQKGQVRGIQDTLWIQGRKRFGQPDDTTALTLRSIQNVERLDKLAERILEAKNWSDLFSERSGLAASESATRGEKARQLIEKHLHRRMISERVRRGGGFGRSDSRRDSIGNGGESIFVRPVVPDVESEPGGGAIAVKTFENPLHRPPLVPQNPGPQLPDAMAAHDREPFFVISRDFSCDPLDVGPELGDDIAVMDAEAQPFVFDQRAGNALKPIAQPSGMLAQGSDEGGGSRLREREAGALNLQSVIAGVNQFRQSHALGDVDQTATADDHYGRRRGSVQSPQDVANRVRELDFVGLGSDRRQSSVEVESDEDVAGRLNAIGDRGQRVEQIGLGHAPSESSGKSNLSRAERMRPAHR